MENFHENAAPFYLEGNEEGCLLIHGFTGTPAYLHRLGKDLYKQGYTVNNVLLKGHGTTPEDLEQTNWQDWVSSVEEGYIKLRKKCNRVYAIGLSMGGLLALDLAEKGMVDKIVPIATPIRIFDPLAKYSPILKYIKRFKKWKSSSNQGQPQLQLTNVKPLAYDVVPLASVHQLMKLMKGVEADLPKVTCPSLIMQPLLDRTVKPISAEMIYHQIASMEKEIVWLEHSRHSCTMGPEYKLILNKIINFLSSELP